ncbi:MAG: 2-amino-4-hydroxy-6-hydroxymethyldihydropteridine diphosphokinase, partial [Xanthobacteraceae bacterium]|nr:2-amino-4-hydroxy-6-hydroxymethyldihydropteridine diphosphokinase [Xanthobacteraceae bacterium]
IIDYGGESLTTPDLTLPHPRLFERAFVLVPLAEIAPDRMIAGQTPREALAKLSSEGITRLNEGS